MQNCIDWFKRFERFDRFDQTVQTVQTEQLAQTVTAALDPVAARLRPARGESFTSQTRPGPRAEAERSRQAGFVASFSGHLFSLIGLVGLNGLDGLSGLIKPFKPLKLFNENP